MIVINTLNCVEAWGHQLQVKKKKQPIKKTRISIFNKEYFSISVFNGLNIVFCGTLVITLFSIYAFLCRVKFFRKNFVHFSPKISKYKAVDRFLMNNFSYSKCWCWIFDFVNTTTVSAMNTWIINVTWMLLLKPLFWR